MPGTVSVFEPGERWTARRLHPAISDYVRGILCWFLIFAIDEEQQKIVRGYGERRVSGGEIATVPHIAHGSRRARQSELAPIDLQFRGALGTVQQGDGASSGHRESQRKFSTIDTSLPDCSYFEY